MVGISWTSGADQTRLSPYEFEVGFVAKPTGLAERQHALVDFAGSGVSLGWNQIWLNVRDDCVRCGRGRSRMFGLRLLRFWGVPSTA